MASREDEFTSFAEAAASRLLDTAFLLCGDWHAAEDLTQTTLAKVFAAWYRIRNQDSAYAYSKRTLLNTYFVDCRRKRRGEVLTGASRDLQERAAEPQSPELRLELIDALAALPPKARVVVVLRYWEDMSIEQVAAHLGCSPGNVKSQSARALDKLRRLLDGPADIAHQP
ncbi:MAG TPA: SigE family RNA polymerase sigma factor [Streptosporangiaceae bacterium]|jgi:RNA polymerase sigma-70 factor (sigma-E family)